MKTLCFVRKSLFVVLGVVLLGFLSVWTYVYAENNSLWTTRGNALYRSLVSTESNQGVNSSSAQSSVKSKSYSLSFSFETPRPDFRRGYSSISIPGLDIWTGNPGEPMLPFKSAKILIPQGQQPIGVKVILGPKLELPGAYEIEHAQQPVPISQMNKGKPTDADSAIYSSNNPYPRIPGGDVFIQHKHGYTCFL